MRAHRVADPAAVLIVMLLAAGCTASEEQPWKDAVQGTQFDGWADYPSISADGRYVAFVSEADNLVEGDTNGYADVFVHDRATGRTKLVSVVGTSGNTQVEEHGNRTAVVQPVPYPSYVTPTALPG